MRFNRTIKASSRKPVCASDLTDEQAHMLVDLSDFAADIIKETERDYGKKLSQNGWAQVMDYTEDLVRDPSFVKKHVGNDIASMRMHLEAVIYDIYEEDTGIEGIYTAKSVKCNYRGGNVVMRKRSFSVKASTAAKRRVLAMTDEEFYTREFPTMKAGEVKVKPHRGNYTVFIGLSDGTIAYQWCESKVAAEREAKYVRDIMKKYGSDDDYWTREGYKIWNPNVKSNKAVRCARTKDTSVSKEDVTELVQFIINRQEMDKYIQPVIANLKKHVAKGNYSADDAIKSWQRVADEGCAQYSEVFVDNRHSYAWLNPATRKEIAKQLQNYYDEQVFEDVEASKSVRCARTMRKRPMRTVKASTTRRFAVKASNVPESDVDELYRVANDEVLPTTKLYKIAGICDIDDDTFDFTYTGTAFGAYLTYIIHVGISSSDIDLYTFMRKEWDDMFPDISRDNPYGNYVQINLDVMVSGDRISVDIADADVYEKDTYSEYYSKKFARAFDIEAIEDHIKGIAEQAVDKIQATLSQYIPEDDDIMESKNLRSRKRVSASKRMRKSIKADTRGYFVYNPQDEHLLRTLRNSMADKFDDTTIGNIDIYVGDVWEADAENAFYFEIHFYVRGNYDQDKTLKVISTGIPARHSFLCRLYDSYVKLIDEFDVKMSGSGAILSSKINEIAEGMSSGEVVSSKSIKGRKRVFAVADGGVVIKTDSKEGTYYLTKSSTKQKTFWSASIGNANRFAKKDSALNKLYAVLRKLPENAFYDEDAVFDIEDAADLKNAEFAKFYLTDMSGSVVEDISTEVKKYLLTDDAFIDAVMEDDFYDDDIESAKSIKCSGYDLGADLIDDDDSEYEVQAYYRSNFSGLEDIGRFDDWSDVETYAHEKLMSGLSVMIFSDSLGKSIGITADEYNEAWENGAADFDINEDIVRFKRAIVNSAKSIKCSDDNSDLTVDISNLELGEPYYEYREDDPENPDKWVLVIGKDVDKQMNFKLWYYMDTTDADLSELDLSNPDHIDLDEMSTMDDYEEIQLSQDIKCSTVTDMHGNQVNLVTL